MLSATKMATAVAVVALTGAFLLGVAPDQETAEPLPAVAAEDVDLSPNGVRGTVIITGPDLDPVNIGAFLFEWTSDPAQLQWNTSDDRLSGLGTAVEHGIQHTLTYTGLRASNWTIDNEAGSWSGDSTGYASAMGGREFIVLTGTGAYESLSAYLSIEDRPEGSEDGTMTFEGVIFPAAPPTLPQASQ